VGRMQCAMDSLLFVVYQFFKFVGTCTNFCDLKKNFIFVDMYICESPSIGSTHIYGEQYSLISEFPGLKLSTNSAKIGIPRIIMNPWHTAFFPQFYMCFHVRFTNLNIIDYMTSCNQGILFPIYMCTAYWRGFTNVHIHKNKIFLQITKIGTCTHKFKEFTVNKIIGLLNLFVFCCNLTVH
jgi:hypothetical protein